jgi:hypothetical protein
MGRKWFAETAFMTYLYSFAVPAHYWIAQPFGWAG